MEILELKSIKRSEKLPEDVNTRCEQTEDWLTFKQVNWDYPVWGTKWKNNEENEQHIRDQWDTVKYINICITRVPGVERERDGGEGWKKDYPSEKLNKL